MGGIFEPLHFPQCVINYLAYARAVYFVLLCQPDGFFTSGHPFSDSNNIFQCEFRAPYLLSTRLPVFSYLITLILKITSSY